VTPERLHYLLTRHIVEHGHAPPPEFLPIVAGCEPDVAADALRRLAEMHGVILEPGSLRIWSLHPFAMLPTAFWVSAGERGWWANCAWCSLAIGAAIGADTAISTRDGGEGDPLIFNVRGGEASQPDLLMHFPYPPARWWDNPYCPCGNILFFTSENRIDRWCERHGRPRGAILTMADGMKLAQRWFGDYASPDWRRKTPDEARAIFEELGFDLAFWDLGTRFR
jgi:hypothetical protein